MDSKKNEPTTVDEYIARCPLELQPRLEEIRAVIKQAAPQAVERISYQMPGYFLNGRLVWFGAHKDYIGFYPTGSGINAFKAELAGYVCTKGSLHLPLDRPLPVDLITRMVKFRVQENSRKK